MVRVNIRAFGRVLELLGECWSGAVEYQSVWESFRALKRVSVCFINMLKLIRDKRQYVHKLYTNL